MPTVVGGVGPTLSVIGTGYLGAVHATAFASIGFRVTAVDVDPGRIQVLTSGNAPFHEPGLDDLLAATLPTGRLVFTTDLADVADADVHFLCVGTPQSQTSDAADLSAVWATVAALARVARPDSVVAGKSTVPLGTAEKVQAEFEEACPGAAPTVVWNPEFLREGFAIADTLRPDRIVIGRPESAAGQRAAAVMRSVYEHQIEIGTPYLEVDLPTAELVKVAANAFLATKISFINAMSEICEATGADVLELADAIGHDSRIGRRFLNAGLGFGGGCLPKDIRAFAARADELGLADSVSLLRWADDVNQRRRDHVVRQVADLCGGVVADAEVTILGAAFKPDSDDVRDSPGLAIAAALRAQGALVRVHDPRALVSAARVHPELTYVGSVDEALSDTDVVVLATEWGEYRELAPETAAQLVRSMNVVDGRNIWDPAKWRAAGWRYRGMGRATATPEFPANAGPPGA